MQDQRPFPDFFPLHLHRQFRFNNKSKVIENIAFFDKPKMSYTKPGDIERFMMLTVLENIILDGDFARVYRVVHIRDGVDTLPMMSLQKPQKRKTVDRIEIETREPTPPFHGVLPDGALAYNGKLHHISEPLPTEVATAPM